MSIWILNIGNSDIQLKEEAYHYYKWREFYQEVNIQEPISNCDKFLSLKNYYNESISLYQVPARVLGLVYENKTAFYEQHLEFRLLDVFVNSNKLPSLSKIIILLTDQKSIFKKDAIEDPNCPFWQDTCKLKPILKWYFEQHKQDLKITPNFITLEPTGTHGIDHWNEMLTVVKEKLSKLECDPVGEGETPEILEVDRETETVYVSHQASTPAISSAVQFVTISQFKKEVKFLVSNQFYREDDEGCYNICYKADVIDSSNYWRGLQIEKAKRLIEKGIPGAALEILEDSSISGIDSSTIDSLKIMVSRFNIKAEETASSTTNPNTQSEFEPEAAAKRIVDALDLIEIFFENENYIQGITLLAASQETFLKAGILKRVKELSDQITIKEEQGVYLHPSQLIEWDEKGLHLKSKKEIISSLNLYLKQSKINININDNDLDNSKDAGTNLTKFLSFNIPVFPEKKQNDKKSDDKDSKDFWYNYIGGDGKIKDFNLKTINSPKKDKKNTYYFAFKNHRLLKVLTELQEHFSASFEPWHLLTWSCDPERNQDLDKRNQMLHNLRGITEDDVIEYLQGNLSDKNNLGNNTVVKVYQEAVKKPFRKALTDVGLWNDLSIDNNLKTELKELAKELG